LCKLARVPIITSGSRNLITDVDGILVGNADDYIVASARDFVTDIRSVPTDDPWERLQARGADPRV
jgi:L-aminopeptidase/D-esterase-like protein